MNAFIKMVNKVDVKVGDKIDVFCSNTDIEFRTDYNSAKFSGYLILYASNKQIVSRFCLPLST